MQESGKAGAQDAALLQWAAENHQVLVTHDRRTMLRAVQARMRAGQETAGVVIVKKEVPLIRAIEDPVLLIECSSEKELENQVVFVPF